MTWKELVSRSYVPYSNAPQCCVLKSHDGFLFPGVRIENISFPDTISAVQAAICVCLSENKEPDVLFVPDTELDQLKLWKEEFGLTIEVVSAPPEGVYYPVLKTDEQPIPARLSVLLDQARTMHSNFPVSAILQTDTGFIEGVNIEVADWSMGLCAERVAISKAISAGYNDFQSLWVHTRYGEFSSPCGACRQVLMEHMPGEDIHLMHADGSESRHQIQDLLPFHFSSGSLTKRSQ